MDNLTFQIIAGNSERAARLSWLCNFLGIQILDLPQADAVLVEDTMLQEELDAGIRFSGKPFVLVRTHSSTSDRPDMAALASCVAEISWPPLLDELQSAVQAVVSCIQQRQISEEDHFLQFRELIGASPGIANARALMAKVAQSDATVLITGESGTGKEVVAKALHANSRRCDGPFVPINCGAIPADLLESELFGHEKGAFTGAVSAKAGRFELANGGTLFLDEIGDMPLTMQVKVLRALQDRAFERVGGLETHHADVRILAATHRDLHEMIAAGSFREDLYYRLNVFPIELEPLRDRIEDLPLLVQVISQRIKAEQGLQVRLTVDALQALGQYQWPGNVRELRNLLERLAIQFPNELVSTSELPARYLGEPGLPGSPRPAIATSSNLISRDDGSVDNRMDNATARLPVNGIDLKDYLGRLERSLIEQALEDTDSVVARAADRLHVRRTTLVEKMRKYGIERA